MTNIECALRLENACEKLTGSKYVLQEDFLHQPTAAIQDAFSYLVAQNVLKSGDVPYLTAYYNFGNATLKDILHDPFSAERISELLDQFAQWYEQVST